MTDNIKLSLSDVIKKRKDRTKSKKLTLSSKPIAKPVKPVRSSKRPVTTTTTTTSAPKLKTGKADDLPNLRITIENKDAKKTAAAAKPKLTELRITTENNLFKGGETDTLVKSRKSPKRSPLVQAPLRRSSPILGGGARPHREDRGGDLERGGRRSGGGGGGRGGVVGGLVISRPIRGARGGVIRRKDDIRDRFEDDIYDDDNNNNNNNNHHHTSGGATHHYHIYNDGGPHRFESSAPFSLKSRNPNHEENRLRTSIFDNRNPAPRQYFSGYRLKIHNFGYDVTEENLKAGDVKEVRIQYDRSSRSMGTAYVIYYQESDAIDAIKHFNGAMIDKNRIKVERDFA
ncbi:RNA-binding region RNP-1 domain-containing protein [Heterostelium album PN500]|uniref:RNA-binding region RNP-1 domain-containing protein n=1 Tax=Heterostelium pallidum (strain ATCC 26659 / Pp 5 / PN500) TaxID=670386 RepID=D3BBI5_HETP5|nr:RNA-binding region RNP-1 domain-containing protein [Heterostelium album PN500]EFA81018.1 RNA-binding region RNP-1 domain-containing protein [Heterostelium album PN500]|eukprot:XP_020433136.1 RNA-binding region RNP-1 domain-containing protein [Heterostelium album PN500]